MGSAEEKDGGNAHFVLVFVACAEPDGWSLELEVRFAISKTQETLGED
jgi:hypothetical protein